MNNFFFFFINLPWQQWLTIHHEDVRRGAPTLTWTKTCRRLRARWCTTRGTRASCATTAKCAKCATSDPTIETLRTAIITTRGTWGTSATSGTCGGTLATLICNTANATGTSTIGLGTIRAIPSTRPRIDPFADRPIHSSRRCTYLLLLLLLLLLL